MDFLFKLIRLQILNVLWLVFHVQYLGLSQKLSYRSHRGPSEDIHDEHKARVSSYFSFSKSYIFGKTICNQIIIFDTNIRNVCKK